MKMLKAFEVSQITAKSDCIIFFCSRMFGLCPVKLSCKGKQVFLEPSLIYILLSYSIAIFLGYYSLTNFIADFSDGQAEDQVMISDGFGRVVKIIDISSTLFVTLTSILGAPARIPNMAKMSSFLLPLDGISPQLHSRRQQLLIHVFYCAKFLFFGSIVTVFDYYSWVRAKNGEYFLTSFLVLYFCYFVMVFIELQYTHGAQNIERQLQRINELLIKSRLENFQFSMVVKISMDLKEFKELTPFNTKKYHADMIKVKPKETRLEDSNQILEFYVKLYDFYSNVCDALLVFNDGFGFIALVLILHCLWNLVETPYFLLMHIVDFDLKLAVVQLIWTCVHLARVLVLIQPCYSAMKEAKKIRYTICKILSSVDLDPKVRKQLQIFSLQLIHRPIEFCVCGLCLLGRELFTSIAATITTYLVILIQINSDVKDIIDKDKIQPKAPN